MHIIIKQNLYFGELIHKKASKHKRIAYKAGMYMYYSPLDDTMGLINCISHNTLSKSVLHEQCSPLLAAYKRLRTPEDMGNPAVHNTGHILAGCFGLTQAHMAFTPLPASFGTWSCISDSRGETTTYRCHWFGTYTGPQQAFSTEG